LAPSAYQKAISSHSDGDDGGAADAAEACGADFQRDAVAKLQLDVGVAHDRELVGEHWHCGEAAQHCPGVAVDRVRLRLVGGHDAHDG
jgi:hypothetical protein